MVNRQTDYLYKQAGFKSGFYTTGDELELKVRQGFENVAKNHGMTAMESDLPGCSYLELEGAKLFRKKFGKGKTSHEALALIIETGLAKDKTEAEDILKYMVENDIPWRKRFFLLDVTWCRFTLTPDEKKENYAVENYRATVGDFFNAWRAAASVNDE